MKILREDPDAFVVAQLESLRPVPPGQPEKAHQVREAFLAEARTLRQQAQAAPAASRHPMVSSPVSTGQKGRLTEWAALLQHLFRKETLMLLKPVIALLVSLSLVLGSAAVTASAAQNSLPGEPLYAVKSLTEDVRLGLAPSAQSRLDLALAFSQRRVDEMATQQQLGQAVNTGVGDRWQQQIDRGLQAAASLTDAELPGALQQTRQRLLQQERTLQQLGDPGAANRVVEQTRQQIQERLRLVEAGLQDPQQFRHQVQNRQQQRLQQTPWAPAQTEKPAPSGQPGFGPGKPSQTQHPGVGGSGQNQGTPASTEPTGGYGPGAQQTPQPGSSYGPGPGQPSQTPLGPGYGQPQHTPGTGTGAGNGNGECSGECSGNTNGSGNENGSGAGGAGGSDNGSDTGGGTGNGDTGGSGNGSGSGAGGSGGSGGGKGAGGGRP